MFEGYRLHWGFILALLVAYVGTLGQAVGDQLLVLVAERIRKASPRAALLSTLAGEGEPESLRGNEGLILRLDA